MKHFFSYAFVFLLLCVGAKAAETEKLPLGVLPPDACGVWCWYSWGGTPNKWNGKITADETYAGLKGIPIVVGWDKLEPEDGVYKWELFDDIIKKAAANNKYVFTLLWINPTEPQWLYDKGVPKVVNREPIHLIDIMPTVLDITGAKYPGASKQTKIPPMDGVSFLPALKGQTIARSKPLFFQYGRGSAVRDGQWKLVRAGSTWELYDISTDRNEMHNLATKRPELVKQMDAAWLAWWKDCTGSAWAGEAPKEGEDE